MLASSLAVPDPSVEATIGVARVDITPPNGILTRLWGPATEDTAGGVHRPLTLTAIALTRQSAPFVLLALDGIAFHHPDDEWRVRGAVVDRVGIEPSRLLVHLSHTHAGPVLAMSRADERGGDLITTYLDQLADAAATATATALQDATPAVLTWRTGRCGLASDRDLRWDGRTVVGFNPARSADDTLLVGRVVDNDGAVLATLVNYACHPTTLAWENHLISPDFVGALRETVERGTMGAPCMFLQGASGELAPREQYVADVEIADRHGREVGYAALSCLEGMFAPGKELRLDGVVESGAPLAMWRQHDRTPRALEAAEMVDVDLALKELGSVSIGDDDRAVLQELQQGGLQPAGPQLEDRIRDERLRRARLQLALYGDGPSAAYRMWVWRLGEMAVVAHAGEAYSYLQTELRARYPGLAVVVLNVTNGTGPYLPVDKAYDQGAYPSWQTVFRRGCLERLVDEADGALARLEASAEQG